MGQLRPLQSIPAGEHTLTAKEQRRDGERLLVCRVPQVCGRLARTAVSPAAPTLDGAWRKRSGERERRRERGGLPDPRTSSGRSGSLCPSRAGSSAPAGLRTARGITSFLQSLRSSPERPGEALSSLVSAGPRFRAALPPARHYLSSPVPFRALPRHHTSPGQDAGPHQSRPTAGGELQGSRARLKPQGPASEGPGRPRVENALPSEDQTAEFEMMFPHKRF